MAIRRIPLISLTLLLLAGCSADLAAPTHGDLGPARSVKSSTSADPNSNDGTGFGADPVAPAGDSDATPMDSTQTEETRGGNLMGSGT